MSNWKGIVQTILICVTVFVTVLAAAVIGSATFQNVKKAGTGGITVTGSANQNFVSDLIVWRGSFSRSSSDLTSAYSALKQDADAIRNYLLGEGVDEKEIVLSSVSINTNYRDEYTTSPKGDSIHTSVFDGYTLTQWVTIESSAVDKVEGVSRDITKLIDAGIVFLSNAPEYYYTKLDELKIEMIADATANARLRVEKIAENAQCEIGPLLDSSLGVFQITAQNSADEEYSSMGTYNTSSKFKTASITVKLHYAVK